MYAGWASPSSACTVCRGSHTRLYGVGSGQNYWGGLAATTDWEAVQAAVSTQCARVVAHGIARRAFKGVAVVLPLDEEDDEADAAEEDAPAEGMDVDSRQ